MSITRKTFAEAFFRASEVFRSLGVLALTSQNPVEWRAALQLIQPIMSDLGEKMRQLDNIAQLSQSPLDGD